MDELPRIDREIWQRWRPRVDVVGIAVGESPQRVEDFSRRAHFTFSLVADPDATIARRFGANHTIPQTFVIDRRGTIVYQTIGDGQPGFQHLVVAVERAAR